MPRALEPSDMTARRFDLVRAVGASGRPLSGDIVDAGPWTEFLTWEEAQRWLREGALKPPAA